MAYCFNLVLLLMGIFLISKIDLRKNEKDPMSFNAGNVSVWMCVTLCEKVFRVHVRKKLSQCFKSTTKFLFGNK